MNEPIDRFRILAILTKENVVSTGPAFLANQETFEVRECDSTRLTWIWCSHAIHVYTECTHINFGYLREIYGENVGKYTQILSNIASG